MKRYEYKIMEYELDDSVGYAMSLLGMEGWRIINHPEPHQGFHYDGRVTVVHTLYVVFERELPEEN